MSDAATRPRGRPRLFDEETVDAIQEVLQGVDTRLKESAFTLAPA